MGEKYSLILMVTIIFGLACALAGGIYLVKYMQPTFTDSQTATVVSIHPITQLGITTIDTFGVRLSNGSSLQVHVTGACVDAANKVHIGDEIYIGYQHTKGLFDGWVMEAPGCGFP